MGTGCYTHKFIKHKVWHYLKHRLTNITDWSLSLKVWPISLIDCIFVVIVGCPVGRFHGRVLIHYLGGTTIVLSKNADLCKELGRRRMNELEHKM
jgi:hypothetical protein